MLEPAFHWARGDEIIGFTKALVSSNCDHLKFYLKAKLIAEADPDREQFTHLKYPPFSPDLQGRSVATLGDLRIDGYIEGKLVISRSFSGKGVDQKFACCPMTRPFADGADTTRVVLRVTDEFDAIRPLLAIRFARADGPADLIGDNPFGLVGGTGAVWVRARKKRHCAADRQHPRLGVQRQTFTLTPSEPEKA